MNILSYINFILGIITLLCVIPLTYWILKHGVGVFNDEIKNTDYQPGHKLKPLRTDVLLQQLEEKIIYFIEHDMKPEVRERFNYGFLDYIIGKGDSITLADTLQHTNPPLIRFYLPAILRLLDTDGDARLKRIIAHEVIHVMGGNEQEANQKSRSKIWS